MELMILVAIGGIVLLVAIGFFASTGPGKAVDTKQMAIYWVHELYPEATNVRAICQATDSDFDGYVSCTVVVGDERIAIECSSTWARAAGSTCREATAKVRTNRGWD
jgi:hypothetical protein